MIIKKIVERDDPDDGADGTIKMSSVVFHQVRTKRCYLHSNCSPILLPKENGATFAHEVNQQRHSDSYVQNLFESSLLLSFHLHVSLSKVKKQFIKLNIMFRGVSEIHSLYFSYTFLHFPQRFGPFGPCKGLQSPVYISKYRSSA